MQPIVHANTETLSLRQLDELNALPKGTSFRLFRRCEQQLEEGRDFFYLPADERSQGVRSDLRHHSQSGTADAHGLRAHAADYPRRILITAAEGLAFLRFNPLGHGGW